MSFGTIDTTNAVSSNATDLNALLMLGDNYQAVVGERLTGFKVYCNDDAEPPFLLWTALYDITDGLTNATLVGAKLLSMPIAATPTWAEVLLDTPVFLTPGRRYARYLSEGQSSANGNYYRLTQSNYSREVTGFSGAPTSIYPTSGVVNSSYLPLMEVITNNIFLNYTETVLTNVSGTGPGYIQNYLVGGMAIGDTIYTRTPLSLLVVTNGVSTSGLISSDYKGTQTVYHRSLATDELTEFTLTTPGTALVSPASFSFAPLTAQALNVDLTASEIVNVTGVDIGQLIPISVTNGSYSISTDNGNTWGPFVTAPDYVQLNHRVRLQLHTSTSDLTPVVATLTIGDKSANWSVTTTTAVDMIPTDYVYTAAVDVAYSTWTESNVIDILGVDVGVDIPLTVSGAEWAKSTDGGTTWSSWVTTAGTVQLNNKFKLRVMSSGSNATQTSGSSSIGGKSATFNVTTYDIIPNTFTLTAQPNVSIHQLYESNVITVQGTSTGIPVPISISGVAGAKFAINSGGGFGSWLTNATTVQNGWQVKVQVTSSSSYSTPVTATLNIGTTTADFVVTTMVADVQPDSFGFVDVNNKPLNRTYTSNVIDVLGVSPEAPVNISILSGEWSKSTDNGVSWSSYVATPGTVMLNDKVRVRGTSPTVYNSTKDVIVNIGGITDTYSITTKLASAVTLTSINSGTVLAESTGNTVVTDGLSNATLLTVDGISMTGLAGSDDAYTFNVPVLAADSYYPKFGSNVNAIISDGVAFSTLAINFLPKATHDYITLTGTGGTGVGWVGNYVTCAANDQIIFAKPTTLGVTANGVRDDGSIFTDYNGTQVMYHRRYSDGLVTELTVITNFSTDDTNPNTFTFTALTNQPKNTLVYSDTITVGGINASTPISISGTAAYYKVNNGSYTQSPGNVVNGDQVTVRVLTSTIDNTPVSGTLNIGPQSAIFTATTLTVVIDSTPNNFTFTAVTGVPISTYSVSNIVVIKGITP